jgi:hypothetical protein
MAVQTRFPSIATVAHVEPGDFTCRRMQDAFEAMQAHFRASVSAARAGISLPSRPVLQGVRFMSLNMYKAMRGDQYELEGLI